MCFLLAGLGEEHGLSLCALSERDIHKNNARKLPSIRLEPSIFADFKLTARPGKAGNVLAFSVFRQRARNL